LDAGAPQTAVRAVPRPDAMRVGLLREVDLAIAAVRIPAAPAERLDAYERLVLELLPRLFPRLFGLVAPGMLSYALAGRLLGRRARPDEMQTVLRRLPAHPPPETDLE